MSRLHAHPESHLVERIGWLRAAVLGANDGIVSTASLIVGVAAAAGQADAIFWSPAWPDWSRGPCRWRPANTCGSVPSPSTEHADLAREREELSDQCRSSSARNWRKSKSSAVSDQELARKVA